MNQSTNKIKLRKIDVFHKLHRDQLPIAVDLQAFRTYLKRPALQKTTSAAAAAEKPSVVGGVATKKPVTKDAKPTKDKSATRNVPGANNRVDQVRMFVRQLLRDALTERYKICLTFRFIYLKICVIFRTYFHSFHLEIEE